MPSDIENLVGVTGKRVSLQTWLCLIIGVVLFLFGLDSAWSSYNVHKNIVASKAWPVVNGKVTETKIQMVPDEDGTYYSPIITYHYFVAGIEYVCSNGIGIEGFRVDAEEALNSFLIGTVITVAYNPKRPGDCVTEYYGELAPYYLFLLPTSIALLVYAGFLIRSKAKG